MYYLSMKLVVGLGNPGKEYENTRHNTGMIILDCMLGKVNWDKSDNAKTLYFKDKLEDKPVEYLKPLTFMNKSGFTVLSVKNKHKLNLKDIIIIHDDIDLPIGKMKISFNRSSGGHKGLGSIIKTLKSEEFLRIRIGISAATPSGKIKKPKGEKAVLNFILGEFKKSELETLKKLSKKVAEAIEVIFTESKEKAMSLYN